METTVCFFKQTSLCAMLVHNHFPVACCRTRRKQDGVAAVEFAVVAFVFFALFFGAIEIARAMYLCNTLQEVTRRAAAFAVNANFKDDAAMEKVREKAIFRNSPGTLSFGDPISDAHIQIDYMSITRNGNSLTPTPISSGSLPASPKENRVLCMSDPNDPGCIRLVRVRVCMPGGGGTCTPVSYKTLVSLVPFPLELPTAETIMKAETLGYVAAP